ncbi:MAG: hypothetical protein KJ882_07055 [Proteobacteria bacterium]|nr:hypothetical protein [Pseudomonadota bacterium]MBU4010508.1 hypothetical protein [Pseudomonadota bacterium]
MKLIFRFSVIIIFFMICFCSCSKNEKARDGFFRGMYEGSKQVQEIKHADETQRPGKEPPTYDQYKRERQEILTEQESQR